MTSAEVAKNRLGDMVLHQYVPLDLLPSIRRFLDYWQPDVAIGVESEIWPTTLAELHRRHIPQILVNARMSDRSFDRWKRHSSIAETLFGKLALVIAQSDLDAERFRDLGAWPVSVSGNIKVDSDAPPCDEQVLERYRQHRDRPGHLGLPLLGRGRAARGADRGGLFHQSHALVRGRHVGRLFG